MEEYDVDVPLGELLRWVKEDAAGVRPSLWVRASKAYQVEPVSDRVVAEKTAEAELEQVVVSGLMEIWPREGHPGWRLQLRFEDVTALRPDGEDAGYEDDDDMTIEAFEEECIRPEQGELEIVVSVEDEDAKARFEGWLARQMGVATALRPARRER